MHEIELQAAFEERENKQKNAKFQFKNLELSFFSQKIASVIQFCGKRKITLTYAMFININGSWQCLQIKTFMSDFSSVNCSILSKMVCTFLDDFFCKTSIRISCQIIFVNKHWPQSCQVPVSKDKYYCSYLHLTHKFKDARFFSLSYIPVCNCIISRPFSKNFKM